MANTYKILGQAAPSATTATDIYTVGAGKSTVINTIAVCNRGAAATFRIAVRPSGAALANQHYIIYDTAIGANDTINPSINLSLSATDVLTVYASTANFSFTVSGVEIS